MVTSARLLFSKFKEQEFNQLCQLLSSVFNTTTEDLVKFYHDIDSTFDKPGFPLHFTNRNFFESEDAAFRYAYQQSSYVAVDLPSLMELDNGLIDKPTIAIIGQNPYGEGNHQPLVIGTPYGLHHKDSREVLKGTKKYLTMIMVLLELGYRVYLTDLIKIYVCGEKKISFYKKEEPKFLKLIESELAVVQPVGVVSWGYGVRNVVNKLNLSIKHESIPHPSGAAHGTWKNVLGHSPTDANIQAYWRKLMTEKFGNRE